MAKLFILTCYNGYKLSNFIFFNTKQEVEMTNFIIILNLLLSSIMLGVILITQIVSYPMFKYVDCSNFNLYHLNYVKLISYIAGPIMILEFAVSISLLFLINPSLSILNSLSIILIFLSTLFLQVPIHNQLKIRKRKLLIKNLITGNWIRTFSWFVKTNIAIIILKERII